MSLKVKPVRLSDEDMQAVELIKQSYGLETDSSAIRYAIRKLAKIISRKEQSNGKKA